MRLPFLPLTPICVLLAVAAAGYGGQVIDVQSAWLALIGAIAASIAVNAFNEYVDFRNGLDLRTIRTPFSGGSGTLPAHPELARPTLIMAMLSLSTVVVIGAWFLLEHGPSLLPIGLVGVLLVAFYSTWVVHHPIICLVAPGLGFGTLMVNGTAWVTVGEFTTTAFAASLIPFFLVSNLLLLNQFPDLDADRAVGRNTLPIAIGARRSSYVYLGFAILGAASLVASIGMGSLPPQAAVGLAGFALALPVFVGARRYGSDIDRLKPFMALNTIICLVTPLLVAVGLFLAER
ncbi:MAG: prenyltransferase [Gammaproteobacteria bacterium]